MRAEVLQLAADLARRGEPFVLAVVVRREPFSSAQQGDMAVITASGGYDGWLGGSCTQPTVTREARLALADGKPRFLCLSPDPARDTARRPGAADDLPQRRERGHLPRAGAAATTPAPLRRLAGGARADAPGRSDGLLGGCLGRNGARRPDARERVYAVVASMGENDEDMVASALAAEPAYISVVASRKRFAESAPPCSPAAFRRRRSTAFAILPALTSAPGSPRSWR